MGSCREHIRAAFHGAGKVEKSPRIKDEYAWEIATLTTGAAKVEKSSVTIWVHVATHHLRGFLN